MNTLDRQRLFVLLCEVRTVASRARVISLTNSALDLVAPTEIFRTVAPTPRPNAELRTREHLTPGEVEALIEAARRKLIEARTSAIAPALDWPAPLRIMKPP